MQKPDTRAPIPSRRSSLPLALLIGTAAVVGCHASSPPRAPVMQDAAASPPDVEGDALPPVPSTGDFCGDQRSAAQRRVEAAAAVDLSCDSDDDCAEARPDTRCGTSCVGAIVSRRALVAFQAALADIDAQICEPFVAAGCQVRPGACLPRRPAGCLDGTCQRFPPAAWETLGIEERSDNVLETPLSCQPGQSCRLWTLTSAGALTRTAPTGRTTGTIVPQDLATIDAILRSVPFRRIELDGMDLCHRDRAPTIEVVVTRKDLPLGFGAAKCVDAAAPPNDVQRLFQVLTRY
jgi:hypothetical protein